MMVLIGEAMVVVFATLVAKDLADVTPTQALTAGGVLVGLCVVAAGLLRSRVGFAVLWVVVLVQGSKADALTLQRERAARQQHGA